ncbi:MAG: DUF134 domain-containing protein [Clostridiales bacterium]|nr:DUF134 domain-containing protein [Clostridiales bacterium]
MPRPQKCRRICNVPQTDSFRPEKHRGEIPIIMTVDEYEVIRLVDLEEKTHEQCALQMDISRSTVQEIYENARRKLAACIVYGRKLVIAGGNYRVCDGRENCRCELKCRQADNNKRTALKNRNRGGFTMKIAVPYENGQIFQHFGHTERFKFYETDNTEIVNSEIIETAGSGHGALAGFLMKHGADTLICGGIGGGAQTALAEAGIRLYGGVSGDADTAVTELLSGKLNYNPDVQCSHHEHHGENNSCGSHSCGNKGCH